jgi:hypothetical protein
MNGALGNLLVLILALGHQCLALGLCLALFGLCLVLRLACGAGGAALQVRSLGVLTKEICVVITVLVLSSLPSLSF